MSNFCESIKHSSIFGFRYSETAEKLYEITNPAKYEKYLRPYHKGEMTVSTPCYYAVKLFTVILKYNRLYVDRWSRGC